MTTVTTSELRPSIEDFEDRDFDPFVTLDQATGIGEIEGDPYPRIHALHAAGRVQPGDIRMSIGLQPWAMWSHMPSTMLFGHEMASRSLTDTATFTSGLM